MDSELKSRLMAAYQFAAQQLGDRVSLADIRLHLGTVEPHLLNPVLRELNGTETDFWAFEGASYRTGLLSLHEAAQDAPWRELDEGVEIGDTIFTHMSLNPR